MPVPVPHFDKVLGLQPEYLSKKRLLRSGFPVAKFSDITSEN